MAARGPLVRRSAHRGAVLYLVGVIAFVGGMVLAQWAYPGYSDAANAISDLGNYALSPWALAYNATLAVLGIAVFLGTVLLKSAFAPRRTSLIGRGLVALAALGAVGVAFFTESAPYSLHSALSLLAFSSSGLGLLVLSIAMLRDTRWGGYRFYTLLSAVVTLGALVTLVVAHDSLTAGGAFGLVERLVVAPTLLWAFVVAVHLLRIASFDPAKPVTAWS